MYSTKMKSQPTEKMKNLKIWGSGNIANFCNTDGSFSLPLNFQMKIKKSLSFYIENELD